jgi:hypothetical protein
VPYAAEMIKRTAAIVAALCTVAALSGGITTPASAAPASAWTLSASAVPSGMGRAVAIPKGMTGVPQKGKQAPKGAPWLTGSRTRSVTTCTGACYEYAGLDQPDTTAATYTGVSWFQWISQPYICRTSNSCAQAQSSHTLAEMSINNEPAGTSSTPNTVELGWNVDPGLYGDLKVHLFTFAWVDGQGLCYNGCGYVDNTANAVNAGSDISADVTSLPGGALIAMTMQHDSSCGGSGTAGWCITYKGSVVGWWPDTVWTSPTCTGCTPTSFPSIGYLNSFGEVATSATRAETCTDMGEGILSSSTSATRASSITLLGATNAWANVNNVGNVGAVDPTPDKYTTTGLTTGGATTINGARYGGPGWNSVSSGPGYTGSCAGPAERDPGTFGSLLTNAEYCPDGATTTGCNAVVDRAYASDAINNIITLTAAQQDPGIRQAWGKYGSSGKSYYLCASTACATTSRVLVTNGSKVDVYTALGNKVPHALERAS